MKILIDMNLSPDWVQVLESAGHEAVHWSVVGNHDAPDLELFQWAIMRGYTVFTHDLDFGAILAATETRAPSVVQMDNLSWISCNSLKRKLRTERSFLRTGAVHVPEYSP